MTIDIRKRMIDEYKQPKRAIQFTEWQDSKSACTSWYRWFEGRGIPVAVLKLENRKGVKYAVFRNWPGNPKMDAKGIDTLSVLDACNGFL